MSTRTPSRVLLSVFLVITSWTVPVLAGTCFNSDTDTWETCTNKAELFGIGVSVLVAIVAFSVFCRVARRSRMRRDRITGFQPHSFSLNAGRNTQNNGPLPSFMSPPTNSLSSQQRPHQRTESQSPLFAEPRYHGIGPPSRLNNGRGSARPARNPPAPEFPEPPPPHPAHIPPTERIDSTPIPPNPVNNPISIPDYPPPSYQA
ncbi:hypothetical protein BDN72DRAFT_837273 [Pluteus cervinus]|uniref:Uncharacterized protein n=1 Tax=Pluteus cervinus TaxID=181527 RepID=A0ACD3B0T9_9AGAR|nr:hypothetical protein BDN72DRAFT_837273 [Pluteus cervinus]